jgi:predicted N-formylglutamate amidohydrolase
LALLTADEPSAFESIEGNDAKRVIFVCDHASNRMPAVLGDLGLETRYLVDHIAWDIGAGAVSRRLQARFRAGAVLAGYSRLVVDLNRSLRDPSAFPVISDGVLVPANIGLTGAGRAAREKDLYEPYHAAVTQMIERSATSSTVPAFLGIHSFTPRFHGTWRPWHVGVLWDKDPRLALPMLEYLRRLPDVVVGDNEPYSGRHPADFSIDHHAERNGLAHAGIEIRQDLISDARGQERWAGLIGDALEYALDSPGVNERTYYGRSIAA